MSKFLEAHEVIDALKNILADSQELVDFCVDTFGKRHHTFIDVNPRKLPDPKTHYPLIVLFDVSKAESRDSSKKILYNVLLACAIYQDDIVMDDTKKIVEQVGKAQVEKFRALIESVIFKSNIATLMGAVGSTVKDDRYPLFRTDWVLELSYTASRRFSRK